MERDMLYNKPAPDELCHHGILGQKWGVRRYQNYDGSYTSRGLERYRDRDSNDRASSRREAKARKAAIRAEKKTRREMEKNLSIVSDDELNTKITRLRKEREYKNLMRDQQGYVEKGRDYALDQGYKLPIVIGTGIVAGAVVAVGKDWLKAKLTGGAK